MESDAQYKYLLSLKSIRDGASTVYKTAQEGNLTNFELCPDKMDGMINFVASVILRDYPPGQFTSIPPHGRWQHFETGNVPRLQTLLQKWAADGADTLECSRRLVDLFMVSVLLDAGAGDTWLFTEESTGMRVGRSEGLAVASLYAFMNNSFSSGSIGVDAQGLNSLTTESLAKAMQSTENNQLVGVQGRTEILHNLGSSLLAFPEIFGPAGRPGNLVDHLMKSRSSEKEIQLSDLWSVLQKLLIPIWPAGRTTYNGKPLGDAWPLKLFETVKQPSHLNIQPFHKLTQWLTYSLTVVFERLLEIKWTGLGDLTGLPEYRNGGLLVDSGVLILKTEALKRGLAASSNSELPEFEADDDVVIEWRALTVALLDVSLELVNKKIEVQTAGTAPILSLAQLLEAGTWKSGRELAAKFRPQSNCSPILVRSDGTLF